MNTAPVVIWLKMIECQPIYISGRHTRAAMPCANSVCPSPAQMDIALNLMKEFLETHETLQAKITAIVVSAALHLFLWKPQRLLGRPCA